MSEGRAIGGGILHLHSVRPMRQAARIGAQPTYSCEILKHSGQSHLTCVLAQVSLARISSHCSGYGSIKGPAHSAPWCFILAGLQDSTTCPPCLRIVLQSADTFATALGMPGCFVSLKGPSVPAKYWQQWELFKDGKPWTACRAGFDTDARIDRSSSLSYQKQDACKACISRWLLVRSLWQDLQQVANELVHSRTPTFLLLHRHAA